MEEIKKHTPGPWVLNDEDRTIIITGGEDKYVCDVQIHQVPRAMGLHEEPTRMANAKLIAAAPELLKALQDIVNLQMIFAKDGSEAFDRAKEAIKKATE